MKAFHVLSLIFILALTHCSDGSGGGSNGASSNNASDFLNITITGLRAVGAGEAELSLGFPDGSSLLMSTDQIINYSNSGKITKGNSISILSHPENQACIVKTDPLGNSTNQTLEIVVYCGYRNEIKVTGIEGTLPSNNALIITKNENYYNSGGTIAISPLELKSIYKNSTDFNTNSQGIPQSSSYYSFLYNVANNSIPVFEQNIFIMRQPTGYTCYRFGGANGFNQILCEKQSLRITPKYELAQACVAIKANDTLGYLKSDAPTEYSFGAINIADAEKFHVKATRLGVFLFYDRSRGFLALDNANLVIRTSSPSVQSEWQVYDDNVVALENSVPLIKTRQVIIPYQRSELLQHTLNIAQEQILGTHQDETYTAAPESFELVNLDISECTSYPEASLDASINPAFYTPKDPAQPVVGWADIHAHYGFPKAIGGMSMAGGIVHPYGVEYALGSCASLHGSDGSSDLLGSQTGGGSHNTEGYPFTTNTDWPSSSAITHIQAYYKWIERAYLSGLRLSVTLATGNPSFCEILEQLNGTNRSCKGIGAVTTQTNYIYEIQDYIDAQEGGPGKGWFRIVKSPAEAREVIAQNKLAVVLGSEHSELFNCREKTKFANGCSNSWIDNKLQEAYDLGLRVFFPVHRFDNAFSGTMVAGGAKNAWMNLTNKLSTSKADNLVDIAVIAASFDDIGGHYWQVETCNPSTLNGQSSLYDMQVFRDNELQIILGAIPYPLDLAVKEQLDPFPSYAGFREGEGGNGCNIRGLNEPGRYLIQQLIAKGLILDIDHMSIYAQLEVLNMLEAANYSGVVSSHGWTEGSNEFYNRITNLGGLLGVFNATPTSFRNSFYYRKSVTSQTSFINTIALGSDIQGVTDQPGADGNPKISINYPFTSIDGLVTFTPPKIGDRNLDFSAEGIATYGLYAEWMEGLRQLDQDAGTNMLGEFMNSAEAYLQMWERAEAQIVN